MSLSQFDAAYFERAIELAAEAESQNNLPIGAVIALDGEIISAGKNTIWHPKFNPNRHAEIEALRSVPEHLWQQSRDMTLITTLEPCLMCTGAILLHHVGRVLFGSSDSNGGASQVTGHKPAFLEKQIARTACIGPAYAERCYTLNVRVRIMIAKSKDAAQTLHP